MPADTAIERVSRRQRIVAVIAATLLVTLLTGCSDADGDKPGGANQSPTPAPGESIPIVDHDDSHQDIVPPLQRATDVVTKFAALWVDTTLTERQWWESIEPYCERGFALRVRNAGRPESARLVIKGAPKVIVQPSPAPGKPGPEFGVRAVYQVPVDRGTFTVTVEAVGGAWLVFGVDYKKPVTT